MTIAEEMKKVTPSILLVSLLMLTSCAIFTDEPKGKTYSGTVVYPDGTPASNVHVSISSMREYIPVFLMLAPHQPIRFISNGQTDVNGRYEIAATISTEPKVSAALREEENGRKDFETPIEYPKMVAFDDAVDGQTLTLVPWDQHMAEIKKGAISSR